jgi:hypothetical protein
MAKGRFVTKFMLSCACAKCTSLRGQRDLWVNLSG